MTIAVSGTVQTDFNWCDAQGKLTTDFVLSAVQPVLFFSGAFAELRNAAISFVVSVRLYVRMEQLGSPWQDFHEI
jgi:hypothetical protein